MKIFLFPVVIGGFVIMIIFQGILYAYTSSQFQAIQKQVITIEKKVDLIQNIINNDVVGKLSTLRQTNNTKVEPVLDGLLSPDNLALTLGASTTLSPSTIILKNQWNKVDVYENSKASSKVVGQVQKNQNYQVLEKHPDWYKIQLDPTTIGWVQVQFVNETI